MKYLTFLFFLLFQVSLCGQLMTPIEAAPDDKAVVYFVQSTASLNFTFFDGSDVIGRFAGPGYFGYECEPGEHLFWAKAENRDFVKANLEAGKIYIIDVIAGSGFVGSNVALFPINSSEYNMERVKKTINNKERLLSFTDEELEKWQKQYHEESMQGVKRAESKWANYKTEWLKDYSFAPRDLRF